MENKQVEQKILYIEGPDGVSGDMILGALIDLGADVNAIKTELDKFVPEPYDLVPNPFERNGINGTNLDVVVTEKNAEDEPDAHRRYTEISEMIAGSELTDTAKAYALAIFYFIAEAEAMVHNVDIEGVEFHEIGAMDSIIDIVGTAIAIDILGVREFFCSAPHDGSGKIECRHGEIPVPVPAVVEMAKSAGIPIIIEADVSTEMITPTGFGIIKGLGTKFAPKLGIAPEKVGYGFGKRDTGKLGAVRITLGEKYTGEE